MGVFNKEDGIFVAPWILIGQLRSASKETVQTNQSVDGGSLLHFPTNLAEICIFFLRGTQLNIFNIIGITYIQQYDCKIL